MSSRFSWLALGCGAYLAFALTQFPAATAYRWLAPAELQLAGIDGTVWNGGAAMASLPGLPLRNLRWNVHALPLFIGRVGAQFEARLADGFVDGSVSASPSRLRLTDVRFGTSLQNLAELLPLAATEGQVSAEMSAVVLESGWPISVVGQLRVRELEVAPLVPSAGQGLIPLGDYDVSFEAREEPGIFASIRDVGGPLQVAATLTVDPDRKYRIEGRIGSRLDASPTLVEGLTLMQSLGYISGEPDTEGRREFLIPGQL